ncbi:MAG TPA: hypothetical protein EYQ50_24280 [Verrucomicrobiales bacterium]|nr:hypothetical protein [Verrucomicrobiales bacterium]
MNIENPNELISYLRQNGKISPGEAPLCRTLSGGVSGRTVHLTRLQKPDWVIKQARSRLKVSEDWFADPKRIHIEAKAMQTLGKLLPEGTVPGILFEDFDQHLICMEAVPFPHENWKAQLLNGIVDEHSIEQFAELAALIHRSSFANSQHRNDFEDRRFFMSLRLDPYYAFAAKCVPEASDFLNSLIRETMSIRNELTHGDYSPKNVLVHQNKLILLDHEVMHFGDGAFDIGFSMTHFLAKALHLPEHRRNFIKAASQYWDHYHAEMCVDSAREGRCIRHTLACLISRVRGKSPLEYLSIEERSSLLLACLELLKTLPREMNTFIEAYENKTQ